LPFLHDLLEALTELNEKLPKPLIFGTNLAITGKICGNTGLLVHFQCANFKHINIYLNLVPKNSEKTYYVVPITVMQT
jgi:hypothetical protein